VTERGEQSTPVKLEYAGASTRESGIIKLRRFFGRSARVIISLFILFFGLFAWSGRSLASSLFGDPFFAVAFSLIPVGFGFPILVAIGFALRWIIEKVLKRPLPRRTYVPWLVPVILGLGCLAAAYLQDRSPRKLFADRLQITPPASLTNFDYWWTTLPGDSLYIFSFRLDPSQFNQLLANHPFVKDSDPQDIQQQLTSDIPPFSGVRLPSVLLTTVYKYSTENPPGLPHIIDVFTTQARDQVVICGDN